MKTLTIEAHAKLNLSLDILGTRPDGYHDMRMVMQAVSLSDTLEITLGKGSGIRVESDWETLPRDVENLAGKAALVFRRATGQGWTDLSVKIQKRIPIFAGLAGGSSDAAAVLRGLNELTGAGLSLETLQALGAMVGSDVPFCVLGGTALAQGKGERLTPLSPLPACHMVICKPDFSISTPFLFGTWDETPITQRPDTAAMVQALAARDLEGVAGHLGNVFQQVLAPIQQAQVNAICQMMEDKGALGASMTGSGPAVFGIFAEKAQAEAAAACLRESYPDTFLTKPV